MKFVCNSFSDNEPIPPLHAFCIADADKHVSRGCNQNPGFEWSEIPRGTKSLVLLMHDSDAPNQTDDVNQVGRIISEQLPRGDFYHWVMVDIPADVVAIQQAEFSAGIIPGGKESGAARAGIRQGINDYSRWFADDEEMRGEYFGYDGPCPPWNDSILHRYHFTLYAVSIERCPVGGAFTGPEVLAAIEDYVLEKAGLVGRYTLNPHLDSYPPEGSGE